MNYVRLGTQAARNVAKRIAKKGRGLATGPVRKPKAKNTVGQRSKAKPATNTPGSRSKAKPKATKAVGKQNKIAKQSAPFDKIDSGDFKKLRAKAKKAPIKTTASKQRNSAGNKLNRAVNKLKMR